MNKTIALWLIASGILIGLALLVSCDNTPNGPVVTITGSEEIEITIIEEDGEGDLINDEGGCCDDEQEKDYSRCWSTCWSKNVLSSEECAACARGERDCVWPWEVDYECLQE